MARVIPATKAKNNFGEMIRQVYKTGEPVIVEKSDLPVVAIIPIRDYEEFQSARRGVDSGMPVRVNRAGGLVRTK